MLLTVKVILKIQTFFARNEPFKRDEFGSAWPTEIINLLRENLHLFLKKTPNPNKNQNHKKETFAKNPHDETSDYILTVQHCLSLQCLIIASTHLGFLLIFPYLKICQDTENWGIIEYQSSVAAEQP